MGARYMGIQEELTYGTPLSTSYDFIPIISESISEDNNFLMAETVESRELVKSRLGKFIAEGTFLQYVEPENIGWILKAIFGTVADGGCTSAQQAATTTYKHTFKPTNNGPRSYTLEMGSDVTDGARKYTSALFKKIELTAAAGELMQAAIDVMAKSVTLEALDSPSFSSLEPFVFHDQYVSIAGAEDADVEAIKIVIENGWADRFALHSRTPVGKSIEDFKVSGTLDLNFDSLANYKRFLGSASSTSPESQSYTSHALNLMTDGPATGDAAYVYEFNVLMPECYFDTNKANLDKRSRMVQNLPFHAQYNASAAYIVAVELQNKVTAYADAS